MSLTHQVTSINDLGIVAVRVSDDADGKIVNRYDLVPGKFIGLNQWLDTDFTQLPDVPDMIRQVAQTTWTTTGAVAKYKAAHPWVNPPAPNPDIARMQSFRDDADTQTLITRIRGATPQQITTYVNNNVTDLASAKVLLIQLIKVIGAIVQ